MYLLGPCVTHKHASNPQGAGVYKALPNSPLDLKATPSHLHGKRMGHRTETDGGGQHRGPNVRRGGGGRPNLTS